MLTINDPGGMQMQRRDPRGGPNRDFISDRPGSGGGRSWQVDDRYMMSGGLGTRPRFENPGPRGFVWR